VREVDDRFDIAGSTLAKLIVMAYHNGGVLSKNRRKQFADRVEEVAMDFIEERIRALIRELADASVLSDRQTTECPICLSVTESSGHAGDRFRRTPPTARNGGRRTDVAWKDYIVRCESESEEELYWRSISERLRNRPFAHTTLM
jgi:hypothetical protein